MSDCEQCAALQRQNDFLANDRDGYVQLLTDDNNNLRAEVDNLKSMVIAQEKLLRSKDAENERLTAERDRQYDQNAEQIIRIAGLDAENSSLSSWQCVYTDGKTGLVGDEHGNQYCAKAKEVEALRAENEKLRVALEDIAYPNPDHGEDQLMQIARAALEGRT